MHDNDEEPDGRGWKTHSAATSAIFCGLVSDDSLLPGVYVIFT